MYLLKVSCSHKSFPAGKEASIKYMAAQGNAL